MEHIKITIECMNLDCWLDLVEEIQYAQNKKEWIMILVNWNNDDMYIFYIDLRDNLKKRFAKDLKTNKRKTNYCCIHI